MADKHLYLITAGYLTQLDVPVMRLRMCKTIYLIYISLLKWSKMLICDVCMFHY